MDARKASFQIQVVLQYMSRAGGMHPGYTIYKNLVDVVVLLNLTLTSPQLCVSVAKHHVMYHRTSSTTGSLLL